MSPHPQRWWKTGSVASGLAAVGLLVCAILWSPAIAEVFRSRVTVLQIAVCCGGFAFLLHPELRAGLALGLREFGEAARQVARYFRGDDDDDGPHAA